MWVGLRAVALVAGGVMALASCSAEISKVKSPGEIDGGTIEDVPIDAGGADATLLSADASFADAFSADAALPVPCVEGDDRALDDATGSCYFIVYRVTGQATWQEAMDACAGAGAYLAILTTQAEQDIAAQLTGTGAAAEDNDDYWLGGTDVAEEMVWLWHTGDPIGPLLNWRDGEPNNGNTNGEHCMVMEGDRLGTWDDRSCGNNYGYVCERPAP